MAGSNSQFFVNALKVFRTKQPNEIIYAADLNEATDEIEAVESILGTGLRTRTPVTFNSTTTSFTNLTARLNMMDAGIRSTDPTIHPQYALKSGTVLQPTDGISVGLTVQGDLANAAPLVRFVAGDGTSVLTATASDVTIAKNLTLTQPITVTSGSVPGLTFVTTPGYTGDVLRIGNGVNTLFAIRGDGTVSTGSLTVTSSPVINDFSNMQHDHSSAAQGGRVFPVGTILPYAGINAPTGWYICNGAAINRSDRPELFGIIGTTYGAGDGATTFNLPDMRGRFPMGRAASGAAQSLGYVGGASTHTLTTANMPAHTHDMTHTHIASSGFESATHSHQSLGGATAANFFLKKYDRAGYSIPNLGTSSVAFYVNATNTPGDQTGANTSDHSHTVTVQPLSGTTGTTGTGAAVDHTPPFISLNYIIKY